MFRKLYGLAILAIAGLLAFFTWKTVSSLKPMADTVKDVGGFVSGVGSFMDKVNEGIITPLPAPEAPEGEINYRLFGP